MTATRKPILLALAGLTLTGCGKWADDLFCSSEGCGYSDGEWARIAALADPGPPPEDLSNALRDDPFALFMGQFFFFDPDFSGTAKQVDAIGRPSPAARAAKEAPLRISCATCHDLAHAGVDTTSAPGHVSIGAGWTDVNALPVVNSAYRPIVFWNGRADSLWALNALVAESGTTMNGNRLRTAHLIVDKYLKTGLWPQNAALLSELGFLLQRPFNCAAMQAMIDEIAVLPAEGKPGTAAFDGLTDHQKLLVNSLLVVWSKAIAAYETRLTSVESPFDRFVREGPSSDLISAAAKRGARLFVGKGACVDCHSGPHLTDEQFHNIGIPQTGLTVPTTADCPQLNAGCDCSADRADRPCAPWGAFDGLTRLNRSNVGKQWSRDSTWSDYPEDPTSRAYFDRQVTDDLKGAWRTPSLRNVALTAPYMHDGRYATLEDVIWHYNTGGASAGPEQVGVRAAQIKPLLLTEDEQADLLAFLETLTGDPIPSALTTPTPVLPPPPQSCSGAGGSTGGSAATGGGGTAGIATGGSGLTPTGAGGAGGTAGPSTPICMPMVATPVVTDFNSARGTNPITFGSPGTIPGRTFLSAPAVASPPVLSLVTGGNGTPALAFNAKPAPADYVFGLSFDYCVDASAFNAVRFAADTRIPDCPIEVGVLSVSNATSADDPRGRCSPGCPWLFTPITQSGVVTVPFGPASTVAPEALIGIRLRVPASCGASVTIDDVTFVSQ